jgi:hypothetical protein
VLYLAVGLHGNSLTLETDAAAQVLGGRRMRRSTLIFITLARGFDIQERAIFLYVHAVLSLTSRKRPHINKTPEFKAVPWTLTAAAAPPHSAGLLRKLQSYSRPPSASSPCTLSANCCRDASPLGRISLTFALCSNRCRERCSRTKQKRIKNCDSERPEGFSQRPEPPLKGGTLLKAGETHLLDLLGSLAELIGSAQGTLEDEGTSEVRMLMWYSSFLAHGIVWRIECSRP